MCCIMNWKENTLRCLRVFLRNRGIKGRNKIQDVYDDKPYQVVDRLLRGRTSRERTAVKVCLPTWTVAHGRHSTCYKRYEVRVLSSSEVVDQSEDLISVAVTDVSHRLLMQTANLVCTKQGSKMKGIKCLKEIAVREFIPIQQYWLTLARHSRC